MSSEELVAGRDLDAEVVVKVMGRVRRIDCPQFFHRPGGGTIFLDEVPRYSTDMAAAMLLVDHILSKNPGAGFLLEYQPTRDWPDVADPMPAAERWRCGFGISGTDMAWRFACAETRELAICRAALTLVERVPPAGQRG